MKLWPGNPHPLGAHYDGSGTNFALYSEAAERVELCLFSGPGREERVELKEATGFVWHAYLHGIRPGQRYGYRVYGDWAPRAGRRCNPRKLLVDPYARAIEGIGRWDEALYGHRFGAPHAVNRKNSGPYAPRSIVANPVFDWESDRPPATPWHETIIYEAHVKGMTARHSAIAGCASPA